MPTPDFGDRTLSDFRKWSNIDGIYYERNPSNPAEMRTWRVSFNVFSNRYHINSPTNWVAAEPTPEMKAWSPKIAAAVATMQHSTQRGFY